MEEIEKDFDKVAREIADASYVVVLTGAGVSAESGIPTFRGPEGLWKKYSPEELASPQGFARDPKLVWEWYNWRRQKIAQAKPNPAHIYLAELEKILTAKGKKFLLITQNIDGLHLEAGSKNIVEFHGNIWRERCTSCFFRRENKKVYEKNELPPRCPECSSLLRPDVVWFGEEVPPQNLEVSFRAVEECDVFVWAGTSAVVYPAAGLIQSALGMRKTTVEINAEDTPFSENATFRFRGKAGQIIPEIVGRVAQLLQ